MKTGKELVLQHHICGLYIVVCSLYIDREHGWSFVNIVASVVT
uniref:Uncharacterized protein n=1 Tax=Arundo donax TaxID=35708 RepID=A0A0A9BUG1_ARUDO